ncbi:MAG: phospholipid carrier-dependent glycosyltransferase [Planctomycetes bacterium]|nr:phospholipid carrier-dependent glycosyltransferase [Planctomycetota bacterium]
MTSRRASVTFAVLASAVLVGWFWWRGIAFIAANGPTFDEGVHLAAGYSYWATGSFALNAEDPPLLKLLWSLPLVLSNGPPYPRDVAIAAENNHWQIADALLYHSGLPASSLLGPARHVNLFLGCGLVLLVGWVAYRVWGSPLAGVAGCAFAAADPTLLALSCVLSTDMGVALFGLLTCYLFWEYAAAPSRGLLIALGISFGLMLGAKFSALGLVVGLAVAGAIFVWRGETLALPGKAERGYRPALELALRVGVIGVVTLATMYAFIEFPEWAKGLKFQLTRDSHGDGMAYLNGDISRTGWFHYFLVALVLKLPLGLLIAAGIACIRSPLACPRRTVFLVVPPLVFLLLASYSRVNVGVRAVLPCVPFLYLLAAGLAMPGRWRIARGVVLAACLGWCVVAAQRANPHEISYFNELAGSENEKYLADSNLDWGQGLPALKQWMDTNGVEVVYLSYFGTDRPESHGIRFQRLPGYGQLDAAGSETIPANAPRHVVAVSTNHMLGLFLDDPETYRWLRSRKPIVVGGCVQVFDITHDPEAIARIRSLQSR